METIDLSTDGDSVVERVRELTGGRGPDAVIDAVGMEAHGAPFGKLAQTMAGLLPDSVRLRPQKALFEQLIVASMRGPDGAAIREILTAPDAEIGAYVDRERMETSLFGTEEVRKEEEFRWMWEVWRLLTAEVWLRSLSGPKGFPEPKTPPSAARIEIHSA